MATRRRSSRNKDESKQESKKIRYTVDVCENDTACKKTKVTHKVSVDPECLKSNPDVHVYSSGDDVYGVTLSQTNITFNNNKFYIIQLLEHNDREDYKLWVRWGRIGLVGSNKLFEFGSNLEGAIKDFCSKFYAKTKNNWHERNEFEKVEGKYDIVEISHEQPSETVQRDPPKSVESKLPEKIQDLMRFISSVKEMEDMAKSLKYDAGKTPLGDLTKKQIINGLSTLKKINDLIETGNPTKHLTKLCDVYYTQIPHYFGMRQPPVIRTTHEVKMELDLLEMLGGIEQAFRILKESEPKYSLHPLDSMYHSLKCDLQLIDRNDADFVMVEEYLQITHGQTHKNYSMEVAELFSINRSGEREKFHDVGNKMLLWHGTRLTNIVGILSQGLRIAPPEAPTTGYMFGKGVYFADISSKSANYCHTTKKKNVGFLILCQVSLGNPRELYEADGRADELPANVNCVKGIGKIQPDRGKNHAWEDGTIVPTGEPVEDDDVGRNAPRKTLNYNEYIIYNPDQIKMRFLVQVKFNYK